MYRIAEYKGDYYIDVWDFELKGFIFKKKVYNWYQADTQLKAIKKINKDQEQLNPFPSLQAAQRYICRWKKDEIVEYPSYYFDADINPAPDWMSEADKNKLTKYLR